MWIQVALFVASLLISALLQPKPKAQKPAAFEDFDFPTAEDGTPQIVVFGDVWLTDWTVIGAGNYRSKKIKAKQKGLLGSTEVDAGFKYFMGIHFGLCNSIDDIIEIKVADKSIWTGTLNTENINTINIDQPKIFGGDTGEGGIVGTLWVMRGASDQSVLPELQAMLGSDVPAYRGVATAFFDGQICSNSPYPKAWSLRVRRTSTGWDTGVWYPEKLTIWLKNNTIKAMNAAHIIYEAQTNRTWGRGFSESQLDLASFKSVADQLYTEGFGICLAWRRQENLQDFIQQIIDQIGAALYVDRTTGLWRLILIRDNYDVSTLPLFTYSTGLLRVEDDDNSANDLVTNQTIVTYRDPISNEDKQARAENLASIQKNGVILESKTYVGIPTVDIAGRLAGRDMKIAHSALKRFKVVLDRRAYALQPASVFKLSLPERGIDSIVVRAIRVEHNAITDGEITVTALQDVFGLPSTNYIKEQPSLWQAPKLEAQPVANQKLFEVPYAHLLVMYSKAQLSEEMINKSVFAMLEEIPTNLHLDFEALIKLSTENSYVSQGNFDFVDTAELLESVSQTSAQTILKLNQLDNDLQVGTYALLNEEIVRIDAININKNEVTIRRGCIDTIPAQHSVQSKLWFYDNQSIVLSKLIELGKTLQLKVLPNTSQDQLSEDKANLVTAVAKQRHVRPYPPANIKLNDIAYPATLNSKLQKIEWFGRNRLTQAESVLDQLAGHQQLEDNATYSLRVYKKVTANNNYVLVTELKDLTATIAYANDDKAISPGVNDFFNLALNKGRLTAINAHNQALKTTQRIVLSRPQVGEKYGLRLDPNVEGSYGFNTKIVEEEFLSNDTTIIFLNRLKNKIMSTFATQDKSALKYGWFHSQTGGWRCEGSSGRVLEIAHTDPYQYLGNIIFITLYDVDQTVLFQHHFEQAILKDFYFDPALERCWMWLAYDGEKDLNNTVTTNNPEFRTCSFDDFKSSGISFTRINESVAKIISNSNFSYYNGYLWVAAATGTYQQNVPILISRLDPVTLVPLQTVQYTNPIVLSTTPVSDQMVNVGKVIVTDEFMFYAHDEYLDATKVPVTNSLPRRISKFNKVTGENISFVDHEIRATDGNFSGGEIGYVYNNMGWIETTAAGVAVQMYADNAFINPAVLSVNFIDYSTLALKKKFNVVLDSEWTSVSSSAAVNTNKQFKFRNRLNNTGQYQFSLISYQMKEYVAGSNKYADWSTSIIIDTKSSNQVEITDALIVKSAVISPAVDQNKVDFPEAAMIDIEFDVPGKFNFETTSTAKAGTGPNGSALFADVSDAVAVKVEIWSVRDGLDSWQKQILEVPVNNV